MLGELPVTPTYVTKLDYDVSVADDDRPMTLAAFRYEQFPEVWPNPAN